MQSIAHVEPTPSPPAVAEAHPRDPRLVLHGRADARRVFAHRGDLPVKEPARVAHEGKPLRVFLLARRLAHEGKPLRVFLLARRLAHEAQRR
jgi:hypothetical protein